MSINIKPKIQTEFSKNLPTITQISYINFHGTVKVMKDGGFLFPIRDESVIAKLPENLKVLKPLDGDQDQIPSRFTKSLNCVVLAAMPVVREMSVYVNGSQLTYKKPSAEDFKRMGPNAADEWNTNWKFKKKFNVSSKLKELSGITDGLSVVFLALTDSPSYLALSKWYSEQEASGVNMEDAVASTSADKPVLEVFALLLRKTNSMALSDNNESTLWQIQRIAKSLSDLNGIKPSLPYFSVKATLEPSCRLKAGDGSMTLPSLKVRDEDVEERTSNFSLTRGMYGEVNRRAEFESFKLKADEINEMYVGDYMYSHLEGIAGSLMFWKDYNVSEANEYLREAALEYKPVVTLADAAAAVISATDIKPAFLLGTPETEQKHSPVRKQPQEKAPTKDFSMFKGNLKEELRKNAVSVLKALGIESTQAIDDFEDPTIYTMTVGEVYDILQESVAY